MENYDAGAPTGSITHDDASIEHDSSSVIYEKCIGCPDVGRVCNGPNMLTLPISGVRAMVKRRKQTLGITNEQLSERSGVPLATVSRFLSPSSAADFKYTTVSDIVRSVIGFTQPVGFEVGGNPCPATSSEIRAKIEEAALHVSEIEAENARLRAEIDLANGKRTDELESIKKTDRATIDYLKDRVEYLKERCEYLKGTAEKRYQLIVKRDYIIILLTVLLFICFAGLLSYLVWDIMHPAVGLFRW